jgi:hypothetical protein
MTRLEAIIDRLRALPETEQDMLASAIEGMLAEPNSLLLPAQWLEVEHELDTDDGARLSHTEVINRMRVAFGR